MARRVVVGLLAVVLALVMGRPLGARSDRDTRWQMIDVPEATGGTALTGINAAGDVVGSFSDGSGVHGFVRSHRGDYQTFDYVRPDGTIAAATVANGINPSGDVVGWYRMPNEPAIAFHGFLRSGDGSFTAIDYPGHPNTVPQKINPDGTIVGCYHDNDMSASMHAVWLRGDIQTEWTTARTMANAIVPGGAITVGRSVDPSTNRSHGWILSDNVMTAFDVPGSRATNPLGINPAGDVVGFYKDAALADNGFLLHDGVFTTINVPGATATQAWDINAGGEIVGSYTDSANVTHGFLGSWPRGHNQ